MKYDFGEVRNRSTSFLYRINRFERKYNVNAMSYSTQLSEIVHGLR